MDEAKIVPTVGRMVYYKSYGTPGGEYKSVDRAAVVTDVRKVAGRAKEGENPFNGDADVYQVRLTVFNPEGLFFTGWLDQGQEGGQWDWMPYQKGQAKKTEELEEKLKDKAE